MFIAQNKVRMHDTDMAGILYFPRQFRFAHDALEDLLAKEGFTLHHVFQKEDTIFVIVHCEANYYAPLYVGDEITIEVTVEKISVHSFTMVYEIYKIDRSHVGSAKTVHVTLERLSRKKTAIPDKMRQLLQAYR